MVLSRLTEIRLLTFTFLRNQMIVFLPVRFRVRLPDLPGTFRDPRKTTAPMYASGTPSGTLPGASGTAVKQKSASQPSGQLPVSFRFPSGSFRNSTKLKMLYFLNVLTFC
jgi:hypothetical protein